MRPTEIVYKYNRKVDSIDAVNTEVVVDFTGKVTWEIHFAEKLMSSADMKEDDLEWVIDAMNATLNKARELKNGGNKYE